jgi:excisionase family DNA binding protein
VADVAEYFHVHRITIYRLVAKGLLLSFKVGRVRRFYRSDVLALTKKAPLFPLVRQRKRK